MLRNAAANDVSAFDLHHGSAITHGRADSAAAPARPDIDLTRATAEVTSTWADAPQQYSGVGRVASPASSAVSLEQVTDFQ
jgi:hypothetical protein